MKPETSYSPQPRFADTVELNFLDILTTEAQAAYEDEQTAFIASWARDAYSASMIGGQ